MAKMCVFCHDFERIGLGHKNSYSSHVSMVVLYYLSVISLMNHRESLTATTTTIGIGLYSKGQFTKKYAVNTCF